MLETVEVPLQLWDKPRWELRGGNVDPADVFRALRCLAAEATSLFLEGASIADDVRRFLEHHREAGPYVPAKQTIWPATERFRVPTTAEVLEGLAELAECHAQTEIADHLFLYRDREAIVEYPDAFCEDCPLLLAGHLARETVEWLSAELSLRAVDLRGLTSECS